MKKKKKVIVLKNVHYKYFNWKKSSHFLYLRSFNLPFSFQKGKIKRGFQKKKEYLQRSTCLFFKASNAFLTDKQHTSSLKSLKKFKNKGFFNFLRLPYIYMMRKPAEVRMGNGKGQKVNRKVLQVNYGASFLKSKKINKEILLKVQKKVGLPLKVFFLRKYFFSMV